MISCIVYATAGNQWVLLAAMQSFAVSAQKPIVTAVIPKKALIFDNVGRINPKTAQSYRINVKNPPKVSGSVATQTGQATIPPTYCSYIAFLNLTNMSNLPAKGFERGDAIDVWKNGAAKNKNIIYTGVAQSGTKFLDTLDQSFRDTGYTLFDITTYDNQSQIAHRFIVFLGTDNQWYALDPIRTGADAPVLLTSYIAKHLFSQEDIQIAHAYIASSKKKPTIRLWTQSSAQSSSSKGAQTQDLIARSAKDMVAYAAQGLITPLQEGMAVIDTVRFQSSFRYESANGNISATLPAWLIAQTKDRKHFNTAQFTIAPTDTTNDGLKKTVPKDFAVKDVFTFGTPSQHLVFSQPVQLTVNTPGLEDGKAVDVFVQHEGKPWGIEWLTWNPRAVCSADGTVAPEDSMRYAVVKNGQATFYTCGASTFAIGYAPIIALPNNTVSAMVEQADKKIVIVGWFTTVGGVTRNRIARINIDKTLDYSFDPNLNSTTNAVAVQSDGKVIIGGAFTTVWGATRNRLARLNTDGSLDTTFNPNPNNTILGLAVQSDDKILVVGTFTTMSGTARNRIARLNADGSLDTNFNPNVNNTVNTVAVQPDGKVIFGGLFTTVSGVTYNRFARVTTTWAADASFNPNVNNAVSALTIQTDGSIVIGGTFTGVSATVRNRIARVSSTGALDATFNPNLNNIVNALGLQSDGDILVGGTFTTVSGAARNRIARLLITGALDASFNPNSNNTVNTIMVSGSGKIVVGGAFTSIGGLAQWYLAYFDDTVLDAISNVRPNNVVNALLTQSDGKIVLGGSFTLIWWTGRNRIARLHSTGTLDFWFNPNLNGVTNAMALQADGDIVIGGAFTTVSGATYNRVARLLVTGAADASFNPNANNTVTSLAIQSDDNILIGGAFTTMSGVTRNRLARVTTTGYLDGTYNPNINNTVNAIALQSDGKAIVGGVFTQVSWVTYNRIVRLLTTGAADASFNPNVNGTVNAIAIQSDGKIVIGGAFTQVSGTVRNNIARLTTTGALDPTFNPNANGTISSLRILWNGDIIVGGAFRNVGWISLTELAKISSQWVVDSNLDIAFLASGSTISALAIDSENNLLAWWSFTTVNGSTNSPYYLTVGLSDYIDISQSMFWLDASYGTNCTTSGCAISSWKEKAFSRIGAQTGATNQPIYQSTTMNFNPAIQFAGSPTVGGTWVFDYLSFGVQWLNITNKMTVFVVQNIHTAGTNYTVGLQNGSTWRRYSNTGLNSNKGTSVGANLIWTPYIASMSVNDSLATHYKNGWTVSSSALTTGNFASGSALWVGGTQVGGVYSTDGDIAEIIIYNRALTGTLRNNVESYLALKYGMTLDQTVDGDADAIAGTSYRNGNWAIVWDAITNTGYAKNVIWLGRDTATSLDQRVSKSVTTGDVITLATIDDFTSADLDTDRISLTDGMYIVAGHNGAGTGFSSDYGTGENNRIDRIWKAQTTNSPSNLFLGIQSGALSLPVWLSTGIFLVISSDTTFDSTDSGFQMSVTGNYLYASGVTIPNGYYFTFANSYLWAVTITAPTNWDLQSGSAQGIDYTISGQSDYFTVSDWKGNNSGYYTTVSVSNLTSVMGATIPTTSMQIKADPIVTLSWAANASVIIDSGLSGSYTPVSGSMLFIKRNTGTGPGVVGTYWSKLRLKVSVPAFSPVGMYTGTVTYTLIEN